jgi:hypothetical protein
MMGVWQGVDIDCIQNPFPGKIVAIRKNAKAVSKNT